jgi:urocanate hydratase
MGGAQPLAVTMNEGVGLFVEVDRWRAERRLNLRQIDRISDHLEEAMTWVDEAVKKGEPLSVGLIGNAAEILPELALRGVVPDVVTDQTSAHDVLYGYIPAGLNVKINLKTLTDQSAAKTLLKQLADVDTQAKQQTARLHTAIQGRGGIEIEKG